jgi:hypothetical protein
LDRQVPPKEPGYLCIGRSGQVVRPALTVSGGELSSTLHLHLLQAAGTSLRLPIASFSDKAPKFWGRKIVEEKKLAA